MKRIIFAMMVTAGFTSLIAQDISAEDKAKAEKEIASEIEERVKEIVTPLVLAEKLKMEFPPLAPTEIPANLDQKVKKIVMAQVDAKYPHSIRNGHLEVALKKYPLYKKGAMVKNLRIRPAGRNAVVSGEFKGFTRKGELIIGGYEVPRVDMKPEVMLYFDPELNKKKVETYVKNKMFYFDDDREKMQKDLTPKIKEDFYTKAGYYRMGSKYLSALEFLKNYYEKEKVRVAKKIFDEVKDEVYAKYNLITDIPNDDEYDIKDDSDSFEEPEETPVEKVSPNKISEKFVRKKIPLFDPSFYDPDF